MGIHPAIRGRRGSAPHLLSPIRALVWTAAFVFPGLFSLRCAPRLRLPTGERLVPPRPRFSLRASVGRLWCFVCRGATCSEAVGNRSALLFAGEIEVCLRIGVTPGDRRTAYSLRDYGRKSHFGTDCMIRALNCSLPLRNRAAPDGTPGGTRGLILVGRGRR
jgi:hypothetical protein